VLSWLAASLSPHSASIVEARLNYKNATDKIDLLGVTLTGRATLASQHLDLGSGVRLHLTHSSSHVFSLASDGHGGTYVIPTK
jgi:hypothetical protein